MGNSQGGGAIMQMAIYGARDINDNFPFVYDISNDVTSKKSIYEKQYEYILNINLDDDLINENMNIDYLTDENINKIISAYDNDLINDLIENT